MSTGRAWRVAKAWSKSAAMVGVGGGLAIDGDEADAGVGSPAADDDDVEGAGAVVGLHGPGGAALGVAGGLVGDDGGSAEGDLVVVVEDAVDAGGGEMGEGGVEVGGSAGADDVDVSVHDHVLGVGFFEDLGGSGGVVVVGLAAEEDFGVGPAEAELLDGGVDEGWG